MYRRKVSHIYIHQLPPLFAILSFSLSFALYLCVCAWVVSNRDVMRLTLATVIFKCSSTWIRHDAWSWNFHEQQLPAVIWEYLQEISCNCGEDEGAHYTWDESLFRNQFGAVDGQPTLSVCNGLIIVFYHQLWQGHHKRTKGLRRSIDNLIHWARFNLCSR